MSLPKAALRRFATLALLALVCLTLRPNELRYHPAFVSKRMLSLPKRVFWAWDRSEDLRSIDPQTTAIAFLDQTILIGPEIVSQPRQHSYAYPTCAIRIAVVRIEVKPGTRLDQTQERQTVESLLQSAQQPGISAFQLDFDATHSQHDFYRHILRQLRSQMPPELPLSITALASWCSYDDWISSLPIDEAVPMMFRMEPDRRRLSPDRPELQIREPLCQSSVGISTRESWPDDLSGKRIYIFPDRGWQNDLPLLAERNLP